MSNDHNDSEIFLSVEPEGGVDYFFLTAKVSPEFRQAVKVICPFPFTGTRDADFCLRLLQYLLFPSLFQPGTTRIAIPCGTVAVLDGVKWSHNYRAGERLKLFEAMTQIHLNINRWEYQRGLARTVQPDWPPALITARQEELERFAQSHSRVYFDTGKPYGRSRRAKQELSDFQQLRRNQEILLGEDHPQWPLLHLLNGQSQRALHKIVQKNLPLTKQYILAMPQDTLGEKLSRDWAMAVLDAVSLESGMTYRTMEKTARVFSIGTTLHQLPREARKLLLSGCTTLDLKAAQIAIAARIWDIPLLRERLQCGNHWQMLLDELGLNTTHKPAIKTATYALLFGKSLYGQGKRGLVSGVIFDLVRELGDDDAARRIAERFANHPVTVCLLEARSRRMKQVAEEGGLITAFDKFVRFPSSGQVKEGTSDYHEEMRSALAQELQSYEQKLMQPIIEIVSARRGVIVVSYLHDGITLHFEDKGKKESTVTKMCREVAKEAKRQGIQTALEEE